MEEIRLYFNLTNVCNTECPFCCMYSGIGKQTYLKFPTIQKIIDSYNNPFELQLEGGEPLLHPNLYLFMEYAYSTNRCTKIVISTNGIILDKHLQRLTDFYVHTKIPILIKHSINYHLENNDNDIYKKCRDLYLATEFIDGFDVIFNVRARHGDMVEIDKKLMEHKIFDLSHIFMLQSYGRFSKEVEYKKPTIVQNIDDWFIFASDGTLFNKDLIARSEYENTLK